VKTGELDRRYHRALLAAFNKRVAGDYGVQVLITSGEVKEMIERAREFLSEAHRILASPNKGGGHCSL